MALASYTTLQTVYRNEVEAELFRHPALPAAPITEADIAGLPAPVQRYFRASGFVGRPHTNNARITWREMLLKRSREADWLRLDCQQFNSVAEPTRIALMTSRIGGLIPFEGRDKYQQGHGDMRLKLLKILLTVGSRVFFSLLGVLIIIGLYVLFLGNLIVKNLEGFVTVGARFTVDSWIMAGVLAVTTVTTTMGAYGAMVEDRSKKISRDFSSAPVKRSQLAAGYILSSFIIGMIMTVAALIIAEIYIVAYGGKFLPLIPLLKILGLIILSVLANSSLSVFDSLIFQDYQCFCNSKHDIRYPYRFYSWHLCPDRHSSGRIADPYKDLSNKPCWLINAPGDDGSAHVPGICRCTGRC